MENEESFNLRWDDFEVNTCVAVKELRKEGDFCDVTLATDGKQVKAHKVILAGGSKFFQQILKQNPHPHPLLYLKGVKYEYLLSMLDFVYTGEANVNEKEIKSFLQVANDLQIKGLIEKNSPRKKSTKGEAIHSNISPQDQFSDAETPSHGNNRDSESICEEAIINATFDANIKVELDDETIHSTVSFGTEANREELNDREDVMDFKTDVCEQSEDFSDDALRPNSGKLTPVLTSPDQLLARQKESDLPHHPEFLSNCQEYHDRNQVQVNDNVKIKQTVTSSVERDDFSDDNDCDMTGSEPVDSSVGLNVGDMAYAMQNNDQQEFKKCKVIGKEENGEGSTYQIRFEGTHTKSRTSTMTTTRAGTQLAYFEPTKSNFKEKTRCIAIFEDPDYTEEKFFDGIVAESPSEFNQNRHLIFFDDGFNAYLPREDVREMVEMVAEVWKDGPSDPDLIQNYFEQCPNNPVLCLAVDDLVETYLRDDEGCVIARVAEVDASLAKMDFGEDYEQEWIYLGSPRFKTIFDKSKNIEFKENLGKDSGNNRNVKEEVDASSAMADLALGDPPKTKKRARAFRKCTGRGGKQPRQEIKSKPLRKTLSKITNETLKLEDSNF